MISVVNYLVEAVNVTFWQLILRHTFCNQMLALAQYWAKKNY